MPRQSKAALSIAHIGPGARRLEPPPELSGRAAEVFRHTVANAEYGHFQPEDSPLLCRYCETMALAETAAAELAAHPVVDGRVSPWLTIQREQVRLLAQLSIRLKIGPKARRPDSRRAGKPGSEPSFYDTME
jgi:phage terminase small subunit